MNKEGKEFKYNLLNITEKGNFTGEYNNIATYSKITMAMLGNKVGAEFKF